MNEHTNELGMPVGFPVPDWQAPPHPPHEAMPGRYCTVELLDVDRHAHDLYEAYANDIDGRNWAYLPYGPFATFDEYSVWLQQACTGEDPLFHAVIDSDTGKAQGVASYLRIAPAMGSIEVGHIHYSPLMQGTLAATEAMYLMMKRAFELGYRRYEWKCNALNARSRNAALRLGFSYEGIFRQMLVVKGHNRDSAWYACVDGEWPALRQAFETWLDPANFDSEGRQKQALSALTAPILVARG